MENDELIRRAEDLCRRCEKTASVTHTAFLTPAEQFALEAWAKSAPDCKMLLCGGNEGCERRAAFFLPFYMEEDGFDASEYISVLHAKAHFGQPSHRDYMSVERHVADGLDKVGRCGVKVCPVPLGELKAPERRVKRVSFSVKSMRFDAVLAGIFGLSRTAASSHIAEGAASLNYSVCIKNDALISPGDIISLRGCGAAKAGCSLKRKYINKYVIHNGGVKILRH